MPHKCLEIIMSHINDPTVGADKDAWNLVQDWLITATYSNAEKKKNTSVLGIDIEPVSDVQQQQSQRVDRTTLQQNNGRTTKESTGNVATPTGSKFHHIPTTNAYFPHDHRPRL
jgi:hypothetical protein